jgi:hypothetical protein
MTQPKILLALTVAAATLISGCALDGSPGFGMAGGCRTVYLITGGGVQPTNTCGNLPREAFAAGAQMATPQDDLAKLLAAPKFKADGYYSGVGNPGDRAPLTDIVQDALNDVAAMGAPRDAAAVKARLASAVSALAVFSPADREHAYVYLVLAWRAASLPGESGLLPERDDDVLAVP